MLPHVTSSSFFFNERFHVSNPCMESQAYKDAISDARCVFDMAVSTLKLEYMYLYIQIFLI